MRGGGFSSLSRELLPTHSKRHRVRVGVGWGGELIGSWPSILDNLLIGLWEVSGPRHIPRRHRCLPQLTVEC